MDGMQMERVLEFKYLECVLDESAADEAVCSIKLASGRKVAVAVRSLGPCLILEVCS